MMAANMISLSSSNMELVYDTLAKFIEEDKFYVIDTYVKIPGVLVDGKQAYLDSRHIFNQSSTPSRSLLKKECLYMVAREARLGAVLRHQCGVCQQPAKSKCSSCRVEYYCSPSCQAKDWIWHRAGCRVTKSRRLNRCCLLSCNKSLKNLQFGIPCPDCPATRYCSTDCLEKDQTHTSSGYCDRAKKEHEDPQTKQLIEQMLGISMDQLPQNPGALKKLFNPKDFKNCKL